MMYVPLVWMWSRFQKIADTLNLVILGGYLTYNGANWWKLVTDTLKHIRISKKKGWCLYQCHTCCGCQDIRISLLLKCSSCDVWIQLCISFDSALPCKVIFVQVNNKLIFDACRVIYKTSCFFWILYVRYMLDVLHLRHDAYQSKPQKFQDNFAPVPCKTFIRFEVFWALIRIRPNLTEPPQILFRVL
jgi:hypothetical protein